ncbi:hypothetical protein I4U23_020094 [Adineta vaga]|nr:hypothetical protein I4U23_020094 [Adineta vaga]
MHLDDKNISITKKSSQETSQRTTQLNLLETCLSGMIMGFIAYSFSFSIVPLVYTINALIFGRNSLITILTTACAQLTAGYLHTHSSRTGMAISTKIFHGFYISKPEMRNRRQQNETSIQCLQRFFVRHPLNAFVLNFMWQTFTIFYIIQTELFLAYSESIKSKEDNEQYLLLVQCFTRYIAGCLSGMSTAIINHLWQRHLALKTESQAVFNRDREKLKLKKNDRRKLLSPCSMENWIKVFAMLIGALFIIASNIPNPTEFHLFSLRKRRIITDILVINGGWLFFRDAAMLLFKKQEKISSIPLNTDQSIFPIKETRIGEDEKSTMLTTNI